MPPKSSLIAIILLSLFFTVVLTLPSVFQLSSHLIGDGWDNYQQAGYQTLVAEGIQEEKQPFAHTTFWRYPVGFDFSRGFDSYLVVLSGGLLTILLGMPLAYNLSVFLVMILNGVCSYFFFHKISHSRFLGVIGMLIFGFSFYALARGGSHLNLLFIGAIPLTALSLQRVIRYEAFTRKDLFLFALTAAAILLGSLQYLVMLSLGVVWVGIVYMVIYRQETRQLYQLLKQQLTVIIVFLASLLTAFILLFNAQLSALTNGTFNFFLRPDVLTHATPSLTDFFLPNGYLSFLLFPLGKSLSDSSIEKVVFFGFIESLLFLLFFLTSYSKRLKLFLFLSFLFPFLLSLGYGTYNNLFFLPYRFLKHYFPFSGIAESGRFFLLSSFIMSIAVVLTLKRLPAFKSRGYVLIILLLLLFLERVPKAYPLSDSLKADYTKIVRDLPSSAVLDLPVDPHYGRYDLLSYYYQKPIVNGYFHWSADGEEAQSFLTNSTLSVFGCSLSDPILSSETEKAFQPTLNLRLINLLRENNIRTLVVHKDDKYYHTVCRNVRLRLSSLLPEIIVAKSTIGKEQQHVSSTLSEVKPTVSLYIPSSGLLYLDGVYLAPSTNASFSATLNDRSFLGDYHLVPAQDEFSLELTPKQSLILPVEAGSTLTFSSDTVVPNTVYSLWYRYEPDASAVTLPLQTALTKEYEDEKATVYSLH